MTRTKEYDRDEVLDAATRIFWVKGFKGTSMSDLVAATGLNKHSMYQEFASKEGLFRECIDNYFLNMGKEYSALLNRQPLGLKNIEEVLTIIIDHASSHEIRGCMIVNTTIEKELVDKEVFGQVKKHLLGREEHFYSCLAASQANGEIAPEKDCRTLAGFLMTFISGIMVLSKTDPTRGFLEAQVETALSTIRN